MAYVKERFPESLQPERLMAHMRVLCKEIGPRPPGSAQERRAAEYVRETLEMLGLSTVREQPFKSPGTSAWIFAVPILLAILAVLIAWLGGQGGKLVGGLVSLGSAYALWGSLAAKPSFFWWLVPRSTSQNVIGEVLPTGSKERTVYLIGHLDTNRHRPTSRPDRVRMIKPNGTVLILLPVLSGLLLLADVVLGRQGFGWWQWLMGILLLGTLLSLLLEERQPYIEGANDNASAACVLLGMAEALQAKPLNHTAVTLLFTGCEEVGCVGMENYLKHFSPPRENTYWVDLEIVGAGNLCYVTKHGVSHLTTYSPAPEMVNLAGVTARKHAELAVEGKDMIILEEIANLRRRGYKAICIAGYDENGILPNWHRTSDSLENIEPDTLSRAARYTWALIHEIDAREAREEGA
jgi:hypothetical protein